MNSHPRFLRHLESVRQPLTAYVRGLLWNRSDLDDALQATLLTAYRRFPDFQEGTEFRSWIFRIASLTVFGMQRRRKPPAEPEEPVPVDVALERELAYEDLLREPDRLLDRFDDEVRRAVLALTEPERAALLLVAIGEFKCREAAAILDMPLGSVMGYLGRARSKLRERLVHYAEEKRVRRTP